MQLSFAVEADRSHRPILTQRPQALFRSVCDWSRDALGWVSANGWTVRPANLNERGRGWAAYAPDGVPEHWAYDPVTVMTRAEGGL